MGNNDLATGLIIGLILGFFLAWIFFQQQKKTKTTSVVFERDEAGRIKEIHVVETN